MEMNSFLERLSYHSFLTVFYTVKTLQIEVLQNLATIQHIEFIIILIFGRWFYLLVHDLLLICEKEYNL